jgi:hypothetical protein
MIKIEFGGGQSPVAITAAVTVVLVNVPPGKFDLARGDRVKKAQGNDIRNGNLKSGGVHDRRLPGFHSGGELPPVVKRVSPVFLVDNAGMIKIEEGKGSLPGRNLDRVKAGV